MITKKPEEGYISVTERGCAFLTFEGFVYAVIDKYCGTNFLTNLTNRLRWEKKHEKFVVHLHVAALGIFVGLIIHIVVLSVIVIKI